MKHSIRQFARSNARESRSIAAGQGEPRAILLPSRNPDEMRLPRPILHSLVFTFVLMFPAARTFAAGDPFTEGNRQIAGQIAARVGTRADISVTVNNLSSVDPAQFAEIRRGLQAELRSAGLHVVALGDTAAQVQITLSENARGYLWVAEIGQGETAIVLMTAILRPSTPAAAPTNTLLLRKALLWSQDSPMLDLAVLDRGDGSKQLLILEPTRVVLHDVSQTQLEQAQAILRPTPAPHDARGRLVLRQSGFEAYLPGMRCTSSETIANFSCVPTDDPWPLDPTLNAFFAPSRNFFTGILSGSAARGKSTAPFFSAAKVNELWVFAGTDNRVRLLSKTGESVTDFLWGSDVTGVNACGGWQVLATRRGESDGPDAVQAFQISGTQAVPVSQPMDFAGPVTALWPSPDGTTAVAISRNLKTDKYEAFSLSITCEH